MWWMWLGMAHAGGYYYPDSGIVAFGRGGAWVASADDQFAQYYNPAGLAWVERPTISAGLSGVQQDVTFTRLNDDGDFLEPAKNQASPYLVPQLGFATPLGDQFGFAFGFTSPFAPGYAYDADGPQRYSIVDTSILNFNLGPSLAWRPIPELSVGVSLQWNVLSVGEELIVTTSGGDNAAGDVGVRAQVVDTFTPGFNAGIIVSPIERLRIGVSMQPPLTYRGSGTGRLDFRKHGAASLFDKTVYRDDAITLRLELPLVIRTGIAVFPIDGLEIETAFVYERWSALSDIVVEDIDVTVRSEVLGDTPVESTLSLPAGFRDTYSIRLGGEYAIVPEVSVRAGGFYERGALTPDKVSVALVDIDKVQVGGGTTVRPIEPLGLDLSFAYLLFPSLEIRDSQVTQINVYGGQEAVVGNGDMKTSGWQLGGAASWAFGKPKAD